MSTRPVSLRATSSFKAKYVVFGVIFLMMAYVINNNERFLINGNDPAWPHYQTFKWWLLPHGLAAACALLLGPMQFSDRLRKRYTKLHRVVGRIYVAGALIGAPLGAYIQYRFDEPAGASRSFSIASATDAVLWMSTTVIALSFAMRGKIQLHRQWMIRSYAVAIVFLEVRVIGGLGGWENSLAATEKIVWICVAASLLLADVVIHWPDLRRSKPIPKQAAAAAAD
jgi:uncharacterized membrane protein